MGAPSFCFWDIVGVAGLWGTSGPVQFLYGFGRALGDLLDYDTIIYSYMGSLHSLLAR